MKFRYIILIVAVLFLALAAIFRFPYGFYTLLRFVVTIFNCFVAYALYKIYGGKKKLYLIYGFLAILFNPVITIHLTREIWQVLNVIMIIIASIPYLFKDFREAELE